MNSCENGCIYKALFIATEFPPKIGGAGVYLKNLIIACQQNITIDAILPEYCDLDGVNIHHIEKVKESPGKSIVFYLMAIRKSELSEYDYIILNDPVGILLFSFFFRRYIGRCISILHGSEAEEIFQNPRTFYKIIAFKKKYIDFLYKCNNVVFVSKDLYNKFSNTANVENMPKHSIVSPYISASDFCNPAISKDKVNDTTDYSEKKIALSVSRINRGKGYPRLLEIMERVLEDHDDYIWIIIGDGDYREELEKVIQDKGLSEKIKIISGLKRDYLSYYYSIATIFILLSEYRESFGLVYLEAISFGLPAVGYNYGGVSEILEMQDNCILIRREEENVIIADRIIHLMKKEEKIFRRYRQNEKYCRETTRDLFCNILDSK
jgi:Glycosyltransferase